MVSAVGRSWLLSTAPSNSRGLTSSTASVLAAAGGGALGCASELAGFAATTPFATSSGDVIVMFVMGQVNSLDYALRVSIKLRSDQKTG